jgi:hypothetical protein
MNGCDPYPFFRRLREEDPVHWCEPMNLWLVTRYDDVLAGLRDPRLSSSRMSMYTQALDNNLRRRVQGLLSHLSHWLLVTDPPDSQWRIDQPACRCGIEIRHGGAPKD